MLSRVKWAAIRCFLRHEYRLCSWQSAVASGILFGACVYISVLLPNSDNSYTYQRRVSSNERPRNNRLLKVVAGIPIEPFTDATAGDIRRKWKEKDVFKNPVVHNKYQNAEKKKIVPLRCRPYHRTFRGVYPPKVGFQEVNHCPRWLRWDSVVRECLLKELQRKPPEHIWETLSEAVDCCCFTFRRLLNALPLIGKDDMRYIIFPSDLNEPCRAVSLGVGGDTQIEFKLHKVLPQCEIYGVDPDLTNAKLLEEFGGEFHQLAIAGQSLNDTRIVARSPSGIYKELRVDTRSLRQFLLDDIYQDEIDYLFIDIEGSEYSILREFLSNGSLTTGLDICHITVELHGNYGEFGLSKGDYGRLLMDLFNQTGFLPIWAPPVQNHQRLFMTNTKSPYCIQRYFVQWCQMPQIKND